VDAQNRTMNRTRRRKELGVIAILLEVRDEARLRRTIHPAIARLHELFSLG
jgi:hypothetical protein